MLMELDSLDEDRLMAFGKIEKSKQKMAKAYTNNKTNLS